MADPYCLAMVLCDAVHQDPANRKFTILGTFSTLAAKRFPAKLRLCVYFAITDGSGPVKLELRLVDAAAYLTDDAPDAVFHEGVNTEIESPLVVFEGVIQIQTELPTPGVYHCELLANDSVLMSRRLVALQLAGEGKEK